MRKPIKFTNPDNAWYQVTPTRFVRRDEYNRIMVTAVTIMVAVIGAIITAAVLFKR